MDEEEQRLLTIAAFRHAGLNVWNVWLRYYSHGGTAGECEIDAYLHCALRLPAFQRDVVSSAVNELIAEIHEPQWAPFSGDTVRREDRRK